MLSPTNLVFAGLSSGLKSIFTMHSNAEAFLNLSPALLGLFEAVETLATQSKDLRVAFTRLIVVKLFLLLFRVWAINLQSFVRQTTASLVLPATSFA